MNRKIMFSLVIIVMALGLVIGGTFAWFTAQEEVDNVFTAGTVMIQLIEDFTEADTLDPENVNPGDCFNKDFTITNTGSTKYLLLRMKLTETWVFNEAWLEANWVALGLDETYGATPNGGSITAAFNDGTLDNPVLTDEVNQIETVLTNEGFIQETGSDYTDYWYFNGKIAPDDPNLPWELTFDFDVCFDGETMGNEFQGVNYTLNISFEAIQASNNASFAVWEVNSVYLPIDPESGEYWSDWGAPLK